jgi:hypothetical protein
MARRSAAGVIEERLSRKCTDKISKGFDVTDIEVAKKDRTVLENERSNLVSTVHGPKFRECFAGRGIDLAGKM